MRLISLGLVFLASATTALADAPAAPKPEAAPAPPIGIWRQNNAGEFEHIQSGLICPATFTDHRRRQVESFDKSGLDVGCDYSGPSSGVTYYLTRGSTGRTQEALAEAKREFLEASAARHPLLASEARSQGGGLDWTIVLYGEDGGLADGIWMADVGEWILEYRVTYHAADQAKVESELKGLTSTILGDIGPRLQACAKAPAAERLGRPVTDKAAIQSASMMTSVLGGALMVAKPDPKPAQEDVAFRCVDQVLERDGITMLAWRTIRPDGSDAMSDEISVETDRGPLVMSFSSGGLSGFLADAGKNKPPQWSATLEQDGRTLVFGYFEGRPTLDEMGILFAAALKGKAKPVGGFSAKGNSITINMPPQ